MTESLTRFAVDELERAGSREAALPRIGGFGHVARLRGLLERSLAELDDASWAFFANVAEQEAHEGRGEPSHELFEEGARLSVTVHLRVETVVALARLLLDRTTAAAERYLSGVDGPPLDDIPPRLLDEARRLANALRADRDFHVALAYEGREATASVWSLSGDAGISPGTVDGSIKPSELARLLDAYIDDVVAYVQTVRRTPTDGSP